MYPAASTGSNIGELLRMIQEQKNSSLAAIPPGAQPESPVRATVQQPVFSAEDPSSNRVVSIRPEGAIQQGPQSGGVVAPISGAAPVTPAPAPAAPGVVAPVDAVAPAPQTYGSPASPASAGPSVGASTPSPTASIKTASLPNIGTQLSSATKSVLSAATKKAAPAPTPSKVSTPQPSRIGTQVATNTKQFQGANKGQNALDKIINNILKQTGLSSPAQKLLPQYFA